MGKLRDELIEMSEIFDSFGISEEKQRKIITDGVYFGFEGGWGDHITLNCFKFARFIEMCKRIDADFDVNQMFADLKNNQADKYKNIVKFFVKSYESKIKKESNDENNKTK